MSIGGYTFLFDVDERPRKNVFFDPTERRRSRVTSLLRAGFVALVVWSAFFFSGTVPLMGVAEEAMFLWRTKVAGLAETLPHSHDHQPLLVQPNTAAGPEGAEGGILAGLARNADFVLTDRDGLRPTLADHHNVSDVSVCRTSPAPVMAALADGAPARRVFGHIPSGIDTAPLSLPRSCDTLDVLMPDWMTVTLSDAGAQLVVAGDDVRLDTEAFLDTAAPAPALLPVVKFDLLTQTPQATLLDPAAANRLLHDLSEAVDAVDGIGACLDLDLFSDPDLDTLAPFLQRVQRGFREAGLESCLVLSGDSAAWQNPAITGAFDRIVLKLYRRAWVGSVPGPAADEAWFARTVRAAEAEIGPDRLVVALGNFAVDWASGRALPEQTSYAETAYRVAQAGGKIRFSAETGNSFAAYVDAAGARHRAWILDAVSAHNQLRILADLGVSNVAIWSLGTEDPGLWPLLSSDIRNPADTMAALADVRVATYVQYHGEGAFLRVTSSPETGRRNVAFSPADGRITEASYALMPAPYVIERYGQPPRARLALTFDDGPDPVYTAQVLDILRDTGTPGAFFVVGAQVMEDPDLLVRMVEEGHEVGSHTFSHPRMDLITRTRGALEHSMMRKLIAGYSGRDTRLYREPFMRAGGP
ncbi:MAG: polysaccharide deacetylase family protein, partial [Maritimibacter sp.]|nr:polysaccharide deacetylase family protein [Maritimibacter sp.]